MRNRTPSRSRRRHERDAAELLGEDGVVAEGLSKAYYDVAQRIFEAPTPVLTRLFRGKRPRGLDADTDEVDEDDDAGDDDADEVSEAEERAEEVARRSVWAIRDVSFRASRGSVLGLVGGGGSGKTTLLKVLSGIVPPTSGSAVLAGRPTPLVNLAVQVMSPATPPEANVRTAAGLVGHSRHSVRRCLPDIFDLAEVSARDRRLGVTPSVYKLAVSTALALESDVLLLDDPFATPDAAFRERCFDEVARRARGGATVLLETRDREVLRRLAERVLWLAKGEVAAEGPTDEVLAAYDAAARAASTSSPAETLGPLLGFNETAAVESASIDTREDGKVAAVVRLEVARAAVSVQVGIGLAGIDATGLWFEQPDPVLCRLPGFHRFELVTEEVPRGVYRGIVQARVLDGESETVIGRTDAFRLSTGDDAAELPPPRTPREVRWQSGSGSWLYEAGV